MKLPRTKPAAQNHDDEDDAPVFRRTSGSRVDIDRPHVQQTRRKKTSLGGAPEPDPEAREKKRKSREEIPEDQFDEADEDEADEDAPSRTPSKSRDLVVQTEEVKGRKVTKTGPGQYQRSPQDEEEHQAFSTPQKLQKLVGNQTIQGLRTMFGQRSDVIVDMLEDDAMDGAMTLIQKSLLQTMVDVLPVVERSVRRSKGNRGVYQLNQCISQIRELVTDIQSLRDRGNLGESVVEKILRPAFLDLAVQVRLAMVEVDTSARNMMSAEDHTKFVDKVSFVITKSLANYLNQTYESTKESIIKSLS